MNDNSRKAMAYATNFLTFLYMQPAILDKIRSIYIFGSAVRGEMDAKSDIDMFIDCEKKNEADVFGAAQNARKIFLASKDFDKWRLLGFVRSISVKAGPLNEWQLKESIESEGITLYGTQIKGADCQKLERAVIFLLKLPKQKSSYLILTRLLFGRQEKGFYKQGLVEKLGGRRLGPNTLIVPKNAQGAIIKTLYGLRTDFSMIELLKNPGTPMPAMGKGPKGGTSLF